LLFVGLQLDTDARTNRDKIREQNALSEEIVQAITSGAVTNDIVDETELEEELEQMQQEQLDEQMLKGGTVPVTDAVAKLPAAANGESKSEPYAEKKSIQG
jgi:charged multivesicular body protein 4